MKYLCSYIVLHYTFTFFIGFVNEDMQPIMWSFFMHAQIILLAICIFTLPDIDFKFKSIAFIVLFIATISLFCAVIEVSLYNYMENVAIITNIIKVVAVIPIAMFCVSRSIIDFPSEEYYEDRSYFAYARPKNLTGWCSFLVTAPFGHKMLITQGKIFKFKRGVLVEKTFNPSLNMQLKRIKDVPLEEARKMLGTKWGVFKNCFKIFNQYR